MGQPQPSCGVQSVSPSPVREIEKNRKGSGEEAEQQENKRLRGERGQGARLWSSLGKKSPSETKKRDSMGMSQGGAVQMLIGVSNMLLPCFCCGLHLGQCQEQDWGPGGRSARHRVAVVKEPQGAAGQAR